MELKELMIKLWQEAPLRTLELSINWHQILDLKQLISRQEKYWISVMQLLNTSKRDILLLFLLANSMDQDLRETGLRKVPTF